MRTTVTLDDDVAAAVERVRRERSLGVSEAINQLARAGLMLKDAAPDFVQETSAAGLRIDVRDVPDALELLEGHFHP